MELYWLKMMVYIFQNRKIQILLKERDGDTYYRVWMQLLTIAAQSMCGGKLVMSENIPMTVEDFAKIMSKSNQKMQKIMNKLLELNMIIYIENTYIIKNWNKYQSLDKYEKIKEQNRERQKRHREKEKEESNVTVTLGNVVEKNTKEENRLDNKKEYSKKKSYQNYDQREYTPEFLENFYANCK